MHHNRSTLTHVPWVLDGSDLGSQLGVEQVWLLNDLVAMAHAIPALVEPDLARLQSGAPRTDGSAALISPGTALGEALLHRVDGQLIPAPSEGGHSDFAARTARELELARTLIAANGRIALEDVVSGRGLINLFSLTHRSRECEAHVGSDELEAPELPALISKTALA